MADEKARHDYSLLGSFMPKDDPRPANVEVRFGDQDDKKAAAPKSEGAPPAKQ